MSTDLFLGIDIGTQGAKAVLCDLSGRVMASGYREHTTTSPQPGWAEHDAELVWWGSFVSLAREIVVRADIRPSQIAGLAVSAFVPAMLPLDSEGRPLRPAILWTDRRAARELEEIVGRLNAAGLTEKDVGLIGLASPLPQLLWVRRHEPDVYSRTAKISQCHMYVTYRLTGNTVVDHAMKRTYAPLYDPRLDSWSEDRARLLGLSTSLLPTRIAWASDLAGHVTRDAARETGFVEGTPVAVGTGDSFADLVGAGVVGPRMAAALYGSFTAVLMGHDTPVADWHGHHCLPGLFLSGAASMTGASLTRWFRDQFGHVEQSMERVLPENAYYWLDREAAQVLPGSDGLVVLPDFSGETSRLHPLLRRGAIVGLTTSHSRGHLYRSLLEGVAYELRFQLETEEEIPAVMNAVGGGTRSTLWTQIMSDVLGSEQHVLDVPYSAPFGDAYLAAMATGAFEDTRTLLDTWIRVGRIVRPDPGTRDVYTRGYNAFCTLRAILV